MWQNLPAMRAQEWLNDRKYVSGLGAEAYYDLLLAATDNEELSRKMASDRAMQMLEAELRP